MSHKQNKDQRYDYICSNFNQTSYAIKLEKYLDIKLKELKKTKALLELLNNKLILKVTRYNMEDDYRISIDDIIELLEEIDNANR